MDKFIVVESGSTYTKSYLYDGKIKNLGSITIDFAKNYHLNNEIVESDLYKLYDYIESLKTHDCPIYLFGTTIFRELDDITKGNVLKHISDNTKLELNIISEELETDLNVLGVISNIDYNGRLAVMVGRREGTDVVVVENKKIIERHHNRFGYEDVCDRFPDINEETATSKYEDMVEDFLNIAKFPENKSELLVLTGGDYLLFYETLNYPLKINDFYKDLKQNWCIDKNSMVEYDTDFFYHKSLLEIRNENPGNSTWWNGSTRGVRICISTVAETLEAKYIIPTRISMIYGIVEKIKRS